MAVLCVATVVAVFFAVSSLNCIIFYFLMLFRIPFGKGNGKKYYCFLSDNQKILFLAYSLTDVASSRLLFNAKFNWFRFWATILKDFVGLRDANERKAIMDSLKDSDRYAKMLFMEADRFTALTVLEKGKKKWKKTIKSSLKKTTTTQPSEEKRK
jgi:hypothetical protein